MWTEGLEFGVGLCSLLVLLSCELPPFALVCECEPELVCGYYVDLGGFLFMCSWIAAGFGLIVMLQYVYLGMLTCSGGLDVE